MLCAETICVVHALFCVLFAEAHPVLCCVVFVFLCLCACAEARTLAVGIVEAASYTSFLPPHPPPWTCWDNLIWCGSKCLKRVKIAKKQMLFVFPKWLDLTEGQRCVFFSNAKLNGLTTNWFCVVRSYPTGPFPVDWIPWSQGANEQSHPIGDLTV